MRATRRVIVAYAAFIAGCAAITGLGDYELVGDEADASADASRPTADAPVDVETRDQAAPPDGGPVDAGPCAPCPRGTAHRLCISNQCEETRRVFVTKRGFGAVFDGGVVSADLECQRAADAARLGGEWRAWFSSSSSTPRDRFTKPDVPYRLLDGTRIAPTTGTLFVNPPPADGGIKLEHPLDRDETAALIPDGGDREVWTGTFKKSDDFNSNCHDWTTSSKQVSGVVGVTSESSSNWQSIYFQTCDRVSPHLYCFEQ